MNSDNQPPINPRSSTADAGSVSPGGEIDFVVDDDTLRWNDGCCRTASDSEIRMWSELSRLRERERVLVEALEKVSALSPSEAATQKCTDAGPWRTNAQRIADDALTERSKP